MSDEPRTIGKITLLSVGIEPGVFAFSEDIDNRITVGPTIKGEAMIPNDWFEWSAINHIEEAQRLCQEADIENEPMAGIHLKTAHVHSMLALAARIDRLTEVLFQRLPAVPHE